ncbi:DASH complex subunit Spc19 [Lipomyces oligophaga]|uniref:DASH complex subunit Spc19 n=1 Tax=Lipomyces oligophaga TaxID=45792 RepID=UPI0034CD3EF8
MASNYQYSLQGCVASLKASCSLLESSINSLDEGVRDFPRLKTVLQNERIFEVVPESEVNTIKSSLAGEVEPQILDLLKKADASIARLERREKNLIAKAQLQEVRLQQATRTGFKVLS